MLEDLLQGAIVFYEFEGSHRSNSSDSVSVVASAEDAQVDKLLLSHFEPFEDQIPVDLCNGLFLMVQLSQEDIGSKSKRIHIFCPYSVYNP